jgi:ssDNA-binding Zn-finger/Zn-ribbon topoisomerase 1
MKKIICPKCGHKGSYKVSVWGTANIIEGKEKLELDGVEIDDGDYAECPKCEYQTCIHSEFLSDEDIKPRIIKCPECGSFNGYSAVVFGSISTDGSEIIDQTIKVDAFTCFRCQYETDNEDEFYPNQRTTKIKLDIKEII